MKKGKRVKPVFPIEYRLLLAPGYDERAKRPVTRVALRTVTEFSHFRYEVIVKAELRGRELRFDIHGLRAPELTLPHSGSAVFEGEFPELAGDYAVVVSKLSREVNTFRISVSAGEITVTGRPEERFVDIVTVPAEW